MGGLEGGGGWAAVLKGERGVHGVGGDGLCVCSPVT